MLAFELLSYAYQLQLSKWLGCYPDVDRMASESASLAWKSAEGPLLPAHFRLFGPHANYQQAKQTILDLRDPEDNIKV